MFCALSQLGEMITLCYISCGEETGRECLEAIRSFRDKIVLLPIENVFPQIKALNLMIEKTETEYLIPLDGDIILNNDAYDRIERALSNHRNDDKWHSILFPLWDTLTERKILALKLMRTSILKQFPFKDSATPDVEHYQRLTEAGYTCVDKYLTRSPIGNHVVRGHHFCYCKYKDVYQTLRVNKVAWDEGAFVGGGTLVERAKNHFGFFMYKLAMTGNQDYLSCIAGMVDGLTSPLENKSKSLDRVNYRIANANAIDLFWQWCFDLGVREAALI
jgi:hypothetical protein